MVTRTPLPFSPEQLLTLPLNALEWLYDAHDFKPSPLAEAGALHFLTLTYPSCTKKEREEGRAQLEEAGQLDIKKDPRALQPTYQRALRLVAQASMRLTVSQLRGQTQTSLSFFGTKKSWALAAADQEGFHLGQPLKTTDLAAACSELGDLGLGDGPLPCPAPGAEQMLSRLELSALKLVAALELSKADLNRDAVFEEIGRYFPKPAKLFDEFRRRGLFAADGKRVRLASKLRPWRAALVGTQLSLQLDYTVRKQRKLAAQNFIGPPGARCLFHSGYSKRTKKGVEPAFLLRRVEDAEMIRSIVEMVVKAT